MVQEQLNTYKVKPISKIDLITEVPGSKSITNRALLLAALANGKSTLTNVLFSEDSRNCMKCLQTLGYNINIYEDEKKVEITGGTPKQDSEINVGSAGTAARFITAMLATYKGEYIINASEQMQARPMKPLFNVLTQLGAKIEYLKKENHLPIKLKGNNLQGGDISIETGQSSQFLSGLLITGGLYKDGLKIKPTVNEISKSYIEITLKMINQFGGTACKNQDGLYIVEPNNQYTGRDYLIEPDVSSACYFYGMAMLNGGRVTVKNVHTSSMQGDIKFLNILKQLGAQITDTPEGITLKGPANGIYSGIDIDMNDCSDQTMTLAALAVFATSPTTIRNISHIKLQESNRILAIITELGKMGIKSIEIEDGITIYPGTPNPTLIETYDDHRIAMAFSLIGLKADGIHINNPSCTAKTFENYFNILDNITK